MAEYYAVVRDDSYLEHYGVKGMRWHVRKALKNADYRAYERQYKKASKRLRRLEKQANNGAKYTRKAITKGVRAAGSAGMVLAGISNPSILAYKAGMAGYNAYRAANTKTAAQKAQRWRDEMEREFDIDALNDVYTPKRRRHNRS